MRHLNEHTIAFYAMGAEFPSSERSAIEAHLQECHGCRAQVEELRGIDKHVVEVLNTEDSSDDFHSEALTLLPRPVSRRRPDAPPVRVRPRALTPAVRFAAMVRRHPVSAGSTGLVLALLAFFSIRMVTGRIHEGEVPQIVRLNPAGTAIEVFGRDQKIFEIPASAYGAKASERDQYENLDTQIGDLDGDGRPEVITGVPFREGGRDVPNVLRVFKADGELMYRWPLGHAVDYKGTAYSNTFGVAGVLITAGADAAHPELLVAIDNDRSPSCLIRMDNHGRTIGEFWHFGWLHGPQPIQLEEMPNGSVLMVGVNDVDYRANMTYPVVTVLDPTKIQGIVEASQAGGFGYPRSNAETYYVRAGNVDTTLVSNIRVVQPSFSYFVKFSPDSSFTACEQFFIPREFPTILYTFTPRMSLRSVWFTDNERISLTQEYLTKKNPEGLKEFENDLRGKIRYWDGKQWKKELTRINHTPSPG